MSRGHHVTRIAGWAAAGVLAAGAAGAGIAYAADPTPAPTASSGGTATAGPGGPGRAGGPTAGRPGRKARRLPAGRGLLAGRLMHGEVVVRGKDGQPATVDVQRGKVTAVSASSISVRSDDGFTATYSVTSTTRVRINEKGATSAQISDGDTAVVTAHKSGGTSTAQAVIVRQ
ncbi:MAG TPA: hypothetical protein VFX70_18305 [Mycobacteriales bacterium]|nr:hypothetical protein [Mycobacteriales bacterium]